MYIFTVYDEYGIDLCSFEKEEDAKEEVKKLNEDGGDYGYEYHEILTTNPKENTLVVLSFSFNSLEIHINKYTNRKEILRYFFDKKNHFITKHYLYYNYCLYLPEDNLKEELKNNLLEKIKVIKEEVIPEYFKMDTVGQLHTSIGIFEVREVYKETKKEFKIIDTHKILSE